MNTNVSRIAAEVDYSREGKQYGFLRLPFSTHESAYGWIPIPVVSIRNGTGPRVLLIGGNHGDEYEGQIALTKLARTLDPAQIRGRIVILPAANLPAALAGRRTSPLELGEQGNLNRSFPGEVRGSPTAMIAHYVDSVLLADSDYVFDLHSGGSSLLYIPSAEIKRAEDPEKTAKMIELSRLFGAPVSCIGITDIPDNLAVAARRRGLIHMGTELGGAGTTSIEALRIVQSGLLRILHHIGVIAKDPAVGPPNPTRMMEVGGPEYYVYSPDDGVFEPMVDLGDTVEAGQCAAAIHFPDNPSREPITVPFLRDGLVVCRRMPARTRRGDCLFHLATDVNV
jgi:predicted deacylase